MIDILPELKAELDQIAPSHKGYPKSFKDLPCISYYYQNNGEDYPALPGVFSEIVVQIDVWNKRSTSNVSNSVNDMMLAKGFIREYGADVPSDDIKHYTMRFRGVVNERNLLVSQ